MENQEIRHDSSLWIEKFTNAKNEMKYDEIRELRKMVMSQTINCCEQKGYIFGDRLVEFCQEPNLLAEFLLFEKSTELKCESEIYSKTELCIYCGDCLEIAIKLKTELKYHPVVLNMASEKSPGGGYKYGAGAQEENIFRRSNYYQSLATPDNKKNKYPLDQFTGIYSPSVLVFRDTENNGYAFLPVPVEMSIIAMSAVNKPKLEGDRLSKENADTTKQKIRIILHIALTNKHDSIILSALGCGAYKNPPLHIAELFKEVLNEDKFLRKFKVIVFAIFDDMNSHKEHNPDGNYRPFLETFENNRPDFIKVDEKNISKNGSILIQKKEDPDFIPNIQNQLDPRPKDCCGIIFLGSDSCILPPVEYARSIMEYFSLQFANNILCCKSNLLFINSDDVEVVLP